MHLYCTGEGSPTIVLEAGVGDDSLAWAKVQPELSKTTRVCSYDRAGMGWSTPQPDPRDADTIASELHALLQQAGVRGPIVLMGHSMAGVYIRGYATRYPQDVVGLIFVDGATPLQDDHGSAELRAAMSIPKYQYYSFVMVSAMGLERLTGDCSAEPGLRAPANKDCTTRVRQVDQHNMARVHDLSAVRRGDDQHRSVWGPASPDLFARSSTGQAEYAPAP